LQNQYNTCCPYRYIDLVVQDRSQNATANLRKQSEHSTYKSLMPALWSKLKNNVIFESFTAFHSALQHLITNHKCNASINNTSPQYNLYTKKYQPLLTLTLAPDSNQYQIQNVDTSTGRVQQCCSLHAAACILRTLGYCAKTICWAYSCCGR